jgi:DNA-binding transcriptional LysR family regulator
MANIRSVDLNLLVAFDALFDERSVSRAAARLALTQPTVSGLLNRLRHTFSDQLFVRTSRGILPTPRAEALAGPVKELLATAVGLIQPQAFNPAIAEATVKLCGSDYLQQAVIVPVAKRIRILAPRITVLVTPRPATGVTELLARGEIDICISIRDVAIPELPSQFLYLDRYVCVARKKHPLKTRRISINQLCAFDHLLVDPTGRSLVGPVDNMLAGLGHHRRVAAAVPSFHILFELLQSDDIIAFVPERILATRHSQLKVFQAEVSPPALEVLANWHPRMNGDAQHKWLRDMLVNVTRAEKPMSTSVRR